MIETKITTLNQLEKKIAKLRKLILINRDVGNQSISNLLFRGQENTKWGLKTTLERYCKDEEFTEEKYNFFLQRITPYVQSYLDKNWQPEEIDNNKNKKMYRHPTNIELMTYLRHHGFPSPLLDWTQSLICRTFFCI